MYSTYIDVYISGPWHRPDDLNICLSAPRLYVTARLRSKPLASFRSPTPPELTTITATTTSVDFTTLD